MRIHITVHDRGTKKYDQGLWRAIFCRCYNTDMDRTFRPVQTGGDADLAFAVVVLASYFTTFSTLQSASTFDLLLMIALGVTYIAMGIYGYAFVTRNNKLPFRLVYFMLQMGLGGLIVHLGKGTAFNAMVLLPLAGQSVMILARDWRLIVNLLIVMTYITATSIYSEGWGQVWSGLPIFMAGQIFIVVFTQMAVNEERARSEVEKLVSDLAAANQSLRDNALQAEELAVSRERNRIAREIHDGLGHYLTTVYMQIQAARAVMKNDANKAQDALATAQNLTQEALLDVRRSVSALRDGGEERLPLLDEIEKMLKNCERSGLIVELKVVGQQRRLSPQTEWAVFRSVQEGLNNTSKHAHANRVCVVLDYTQVDRVHFAVQDDGIGAQDIAGGFGLIGIRERIHLLNGAFYIETAPGAGFKLEAHIPD